MVVRIRLQPGLQPAQGLVFGVPSAESVFHAIGTVFGQPGLLVVRAQTGDGIHQVGQLTVLLRGHAADELIQAIARRMHSEGAPLVGNLGAVLELQTGVVQQTAGEDEFIEIIRAARVWICGAGFWIVAAGGGSRQSFRGLFGEDAALAEVVPMPGGPLDARGGEGIAPQLVHCVLTDGMLQAKLARVQRNQRGGDIAGGGCRIHLAGVIR